MQNPSKIELKESPSFLFSVCSEPQHDNMPFQLGDHNTSHIQGLGFRTCIRIKNWWIVFILETGPFWYWQISVCPFCRFLLQNTVTFSACGKTVQSVSVETWKSWPWDYCWFNQKTHFLSLSWWWRKLVHQTVTYQKRWVDDWENVWYFLSNVVGRLTKEGEWCVCKKNNKKKQTH